MLSMVNADAIDKGVEPWCSATAFYLASQSCASQSSYGRALFPIRPLAVR